ncbi:hypothetical protein FI667_g16249, partial [Globisporangium splendens]
MRSLSLLTPVSVAQTPPTAGTNPTDPTDRTTASTTTMQAHTEVPKHAESGSPPPSHSPSHCTTLSSSSSSQLVAAVSYAPSSSNSYLQAALNESPVHTKHASLVGTISQDKLPIYTNANNGRQRATSFMAAKQIPHRLAMNYRELARDFRALKPFTRLPDGTYPPGTRCAFCEIGTPKTVFFSCQHKCVCDMCIKLHDICADHARPSAWRY